LLDKQKWAEHTGGSNAPINTAFGPMAPHAKVDTSSAANAANSIIDNIIKNQQSQPPWITPVNTPKGFKWTSENNIPKLGRDTYGVAEGPRAYPKGQGHPGVVLVDKAGLPKGTPHARASDRAAISAHELPHNFLPGQSGGIVEHALNKLMGSKPGNPGSTSSGTYNPNKGGVTINTQGGAARSRLHGGAMGGGGENIARLMGPGSLRNFWNDWVLGKRDRGYKQTNAEALRQQQLQTLDNLFRAK